VPPSSLRLWPLMFVVAFAAGAANAQVPHLVER
jgi:hypothetical protein